MCTISLLTLPAGNLAGQRMVNGGRRGGSILVPRPARSLAPVSDVQLGLLRRHIYGSGVPGLIGGPLGAHIKLCRTISANETCEGPEGHGAPVSDDGRTSTSNHQHAGTSLMQNNEVKHE